jgi:hypothetical protein
MTIRNSIQLLALHCSELLSDYRLPEILVDGISISTVIIHFWKILNHGFAHRRKTFDRGIQNYSPIADTSIPAVTMLRRSLSMYVFYDNIFPLCLVRLQVFQAGIMKNGVF